MRTIKYQIELSNNLKEKISNNSARTKDLIKFLLENTYFTCNKTDINKIALKDLMYKKRNIVKAEIDIIDGLIFLYTLPEDEEYLKGELIQEINYNITNNKIKITSSHTCYCNIEKINKLNKKYLLDLYKNVSHLAKSQNISISRKNGYKKYINDNWNTYQEKIDYCNNIFNDAKKAFEEVKKRGLHIPTCNDIVYENASTIRNKYIKYTQDNTINKIHSINSHLTRLYKDLISQEEGYRKVKIYI
jgi:hypothetical protein